jgi:hypothetical protein
LRNYAIAVTRLDRLCVSAESRIVFRLGVGAGYSPIRDGSLLTWSALWTLVTLASFGLVTAIIPNPVFGRGVPVEPFAVVVWLASAPLIGMVMATYFVPVPASGPVLLDNGQGPSNGKPSARRDGTTMGSIGGFAAFLAIGCPTCNKIALLLLGASGATSVFAPIQPLIGAASLALLAGTLVWRLRLRARGGGCEVPQRGVAQH